MLLCKYTKLDTAAYLPHLDVLRGVGMAIRRSGIEVAFSEGFNPHMQLYFSQPLPLGTQSECEYFAVAAKVTKEQFLSKMMDNLPNGINVTKVAEVEGNPNIAAVVKSADYEVRLNEGVFDNTMIDIILSKPEFIIEYVAKNKLESKEVRSMIYDLKSDGNVLNMRVACGNSNLRADRLAFNILKFCKQECQCMDIVKKKMYNDTQGIGDIDKIYL